VKLDSSSAKADLLKRVRRLEGQARGVAKMIEDDRDCGEILQQLAAIRSAAHRATVTLVRAYSAECVMSDSPPEEIADALAYAHRMGVLHRDIKPANVLLTENADAKVVDFGIARPTDEGGSAEQTGTAAGTLLYMAPEQLEGGEAYARTDIFALGVSMYFAVSGKYHFKADTIPVAFKVISAGEFVPLNECGRFVPPDLAVIIEKCIAKDPAARPEQPKA